MRVSYYINDSSVAVVEVLNENKTKKHGKLEMQGNDDAIHQMIHSILFLN